MGIKLTKQVSFDCSPPHQIKPSELHDGLLIEPPTDKYVLRHEAQTDNRTLADQIYLLACKWDIQDDYYRQISERLRTLDHIFETDESAFDTRRLAKEYRRVEKEYEEIREKQSQLEHEIEVLQLAEKERELQVLWSPPEMQNEPYDEAPYSLPTVPEAASCNALDSDDTAVSISSQSNPANQSQDSQPCDSPTEVRGDHETYDAEIDWICMCVQQHGKVPKRESGFLDDPNWVIFTADYFERNDNSSPSLKLKKLSLLSNMLEDSREQIRIRLEIVFAPFKRKDSQDDCWLYAQHGSADGKLETARLTVGISWSDPETFGTFKRQSLRLQIGTWYMLLHGTMTPEQKWGFVHGGWELSHLCGQAPCVKPEHLTMEPWKINMQRVGCHRAREEDYYLCSHSPRCLMRDKAGKPKALKLLEDEYKKIYRDQRRGCPNGIVGAAKRRPPAAAKAIKNANMNRKRKSAATSTDEHDDAPARTRRRQPDQISNADQTLELPSSSPPSSDETSLTSPPRDLPDIFTPAKSFSSKARPNSLRVNENFRTLLDPAKESKKLHLTSERCQVTKVANAGPESHWLNDYLA